MLKAILRKGVIVPQEPLPEEWAEGASLEVALADVPKVDIDVWAMSMELLCADIPPDQEEIRGSDINQHRKQAKEQIRREMGLST